MFTNKTDNEKTVGGMASVSAMDRQIPAAERRKKFRRKVLMVGGGVAAVVLAVFVANSFLQSGVKRESLVVDVVDRGTLEASVAATGKVVPAFEEAIVTPVSARVMEVYAQSGDTVDEGTPLLRLDLQSVEAEYAKSVDEHEMKRLQMERLKADADTRLNDRAVQITVAEMKLNRLESELRDERYLDSLGSGTADRVRQAELAVNTGRLELRQLRQQYANEEKSQLADLRMKELELNIHAKSVGEIRRTLDDAAIRSPRKATLTYINNEVGAQIGAGTKVAVISDLSHFRLDCEIADAYADRVVVGGKVLVKVGKERLEGMVGSVNPLSREGMISFRVVLKEDNHPVLRSGLNADVHVFTSVKDDVLRLRNASFYRGTGECDLFVFTSDKELERRRVRLGACNFEKVEVVSGLNEGDRVVVSDMNRFRNRDVLTVE